ncbi:MAG TPA: MarR family winged helix-turn-helix transcriptional regulator [Acidimicrobiales bacterium]
MGLTGVADVAGGIDLAVPGTASTGPAPIGAASTGSGTLAAPGTLAGPPGVVVLLTQLARVVYRRTPESVLGMRLKEFVALSLLRDHPAAPQQAMGEAMCLDPNNLVLLLNDLEAAGYARRRRDPVDRRRHIVDITPKGVRALQRAERGLESVEDDVLSALDPGERAALRALLAKALDGA